MPDDTGSHRLLVKICGLTSPRDALRAVELGADLLGLNFHPPSPRCLKRQQALEIARAVAGRVPLVGIFVNRGVTEVEDLAAAVGLGLIQLHGDEGPEHVAAFGRRAIKVFRRGQLPEADEIGAYPRAWGFLFDAPHANLYGGSGAPWAWGEVAGSPELPERVAGRPVLLAGGLRPDNVRAAVRSVMAPARAARWTLGIDVCSGVESSPGVKDPDLLERFFMEVRDGQSSESS